MNREPIRLFVTGGTFDKKYNELTGSLFFEDTHLPEMLRLGRSRVDLAIDTLIMIDSTQMTGADRTPIVEHCRMPPAPRAPIPDRTVAHARTAGTLAPPP